MPKPHTFPTLFDAVKTVSISFLAKHRYLKPNQLQSGTITWSNNGNKTGSISIQVNTQSEHPYIELDYICNEALIKYRVQLVSALSNLGKGLVWYFVCPRTGKRCRKLYLADTYFYHRSAFTGCMYEKQTQSKYARMLDKKFGIVFKTDELYNQLHKKHFKRYYAGKPTKRFLQITKQLQQADNFSLRELEAF